MYMELLNIHLIIYMGLLYTHIFHLWNKCFDVNSYLWVGKTSCTEAGGRVCLNNSNAVTHLCFHNMFLPSARVYLCLTIKALCEPSLSCLPLKPRTLFSVDSFQLLVHLRITHCHIYKGRRYNWRLFQAVPVLCCFVLIYCLEGQIESKDLTP